MGSPKCPVEGCTNSRAKKGIQDGRQKWRGKCAKHGGAYRRLRNMKRLSSKRRKSIPNETCSWCGIEGTCDRHRIKPELGYVPSNVIVLCENCHHKIHSLTQASAV